MIATNQVRSLVLSSPMPCPSYFKLFRIVIILAISSSPPPGQLKLWRQRYSIRVCLHTLRFAVVLEIVVAAVDTAGGVAILGVAGLGGDAE